MLYPDNLPAALPSNLFGSVLDLLAYWVSPFKSTVIVSNVEPVVPLSAGNVILNSCLGGVVPVVGLVIAPFEPNLTSTDASFGWIAILLPFESVISDGNVNVQVVSPLLSVAPLVNCKFNLYNSPKES